MMRYRILVSKTRLICIAVLLTVLHGCSSGPVEDTPPQPISAAEELLHQGIQQYRDNDFAAANKSFQRALIQYRSFDQREGVATSLMNLARVNMAVNHNMDAERYLADATSIIESDAIHTLEQHLDLLRSTLALKQGHLDQASTLLDKVLDTKDPALRLAALKNRTTLAFTSNSTDKARWLERYRQASNQDMARDSHAARILRFDAELASTIAEKRALLNRSLDISRSNADRLAIAAALTQWGNAESEEAEHMEAEDKYLRALFIRHRLGDVESCIILLNALDQQYRVTGNSRQEKTQQWIRRLDEGDLSHWQQLYEDFESFPLTDP